LLRLLSGILGAGVIMMTLDKVRQRKSKRMRNRYIFRVVVLAILLSAIIFALISNFQKDRSIYKPGDKAPDFTLQQVNKSNELETVQLSDFEGKGVMLNFWATYCKPCEEEMPYMQELYPEYKDKGIEIVAVSLDVSELVIDKFIDKYDLTFAIPHDTKGETRDLYKVTNIPSTVFINPDGTISEIVDGALSLDRLENYFQQIQP